MFAAVGRTVLLVLVAAAFLAACRTPAPALKPTTGGAADPRERLADERWARATQGLAFDAPSGLVAVEPLATAGVSAVEHLARGQSLLQSNRIDDAIEAYALAVRTDPSRADAFVGLGTTIKLEGRLDEAIVALRTALDRDPRHVEARYQLAMALWTKGLPDDATHQMNSVLVEDAAHVRAHERLAVWSYYGGEYARAWRHLHRAEELGGAVPAQLSSMLASKMPDPAAD